MYLEELEEKEDLMNDPLYRFISLSDNLKDQLDADFLDELEFGRPYSTSDAARLLKRSDGNLRYYLRELDDYIAASRFGRNYKLECIHVYRLHLVLILMEDGLSVQDIAVQLGLQGKGHVTKSSGPLQTATEVIEKKIHHLDEQDQKILNVLSHHQETNQVIVKHLQIDREHRELTTELHNITMKLHVKKEEVKRRKLEIRHQKQTDHFLQVLRESTKTRGFLSQLFKKSPEIEIQAFSENDIVNHPHIKQINDEIQELLLRQNTTQEKLNEIKNKITQSEQRLFEAGPENNRIENNN